MLRNSVIGGLVAALALGGCSSDPAGAGGSGASSGDGGASATSGTGGATSSTSGSGGEGPSCPGPGYGGNPTAQAVDHVDATIIDTEGNPVSGLQVQLCGVDVCLNGETGADGKVRIEGGAGRMMTKPAFKWGDGLAYAKLAVPLTDAVYSPTEPLVAVALPDLATGVALAAGESVTSGDVTVTIAAGASIDIDTLLNDTPEKERLRAVEIPVDAAKPAFDPALPAPELVFALAPVDTAVCPAAAVSVANTAGLPAGADVEFYLHGLDTREDFAPYSGWAKVSDGKVTADGARIETAPDGGLPVLGVFGIHQK